MTLSNRNTVFKAGIVFSLAILVFLLIASYTALPFYPELLRTAAGRSSDFLAAANIRFLAPVPLVPYITMITAVFYSLITMVFIFYYFEKTQSPEILFVAFFALSFSFEAARIMPPLRIALELPGVSLSLAQRFLLFGRYFGIFSIFTASVCAAGLELQSQRSAILIITLSALVIAVGIPVDGFSWDSSFSMISGYSTMFALVEVALTLITAISFVVSAQTRSSREYLFIGGGTFLALLGRGLFLRADTWLTPLPGLVCLVLGTLFICGKLRQVYLWL
ncbi:MAG: hypothetical protein LBE17_04100 [Treponema sp.]|jgi:hypothetical protein|nr:hypothetical protein [Treponema sp.]